MNNKKISIRIFLYSSRIDGKKEEENEEEEEKNESKKNIK